MNDYYIHAVYQVNDIIEKVKTCTNYNSSGPSNETEKTRKNVIENIDKDNKKIYTIYKSNSGEYKRGTLVISEEIDNKE